MNTSNTTSTIIERIIIGIIVQLLLLLLVTKNKNTTSLLSTKLVVPAPKPRRRRQQQQRCPYNNTIHLHFIFVLTVSLILHTTTSKAYTDAFKVFHNSHYYSRCHRVDYGVVCSSSSSSSNTSNRWQRQIIISLSLSKSSRLNSNNNNIIENDNNSKPVIRLNKIFIEYSRRQADTIIQDGRVKVNGIIATPGTKITSNDKILLDDKVYEKHIKHGVISTSNNNNNNNKRKYYYIKYWKPIGIICTTDRNIPNNIINEIENNSISQYELPTTNNNNNNKNNNNNDIIRLFPVGRLDKDTSGIILLTNDGRVPNSVLRGIYKLPKIYHVTVNKSINNNIINQLEQGVIITTMAQRDRTTKPLTARTLPCTIRQLTKTQIEMTIVEGRNRQIRKMLEAVGYKVIKLHRIKFMNITLSNLYYPNEWTYLTKHEQSIIENAIHNAKEAQEKIK